MGWRCLVLTFAIRKLFSPQGSVFESSKVSQASLLPLYLAQIFFSSFSQQIPFIHNIRVNKEVTVVVPANAVCHLLKIQQRTEKEGGSIRRGSSSYQFTTHLEREWNKVNTTKWNRPGEKFSSMGSYVKVRLGPFYYGSLVECKTEGVLD